MAADPKTEEWTGDLTIRCRPACSRNEAIGRAMAKEVLPDRPVSEPRRDLTPTLGGQRQRHLRDDLVDIERYTMKGAAKPFAARRCPSQP